MYKRLIAAIFLVGLFVFSGCESDGVIEEAGPPVFNPNPYDPKDDKKSKVKPISDPSTRVVYNAN